MNSFTPKLSFPRLLREKRDFRTAAKHSALQAETEGSKTTSDIVVQIRARAHSANIRANTVLYLLIFSVLCGLVFYLGQPLWKKNVDGRKQTLNENILGVEKSISQLKDSLTSQTNDLVRALSQNIVFVETNSTASLRGHHKTKKGIVFYGSEGTVLHSNIAGTVFEEAKIETHTEATLKGHIEIEGGLLFYGTDGTLVRSDYGARNFKLETIATQTSTEFNNHVETDENYILYGTDGAMLKVEKGSLKVSSLPHPNRSNVHFNGHVAIGSSILFYGSEKFDGVFIQANKDVTEFEENNSTNNQTPLPTVSGWVIGHLERDEEFLFYTDNGSFYKTGKDAISVSEHLAKTIHKGTITGHVPLADENLFYGADGKILRSDKRVAFFNDKPIQTYTNTWISGHVETENGLVFYGDEGVVFRLTDELAIKAKNLLEIKELVPTKKVSSKAGDLEKAAHKHQEFIADVNAQLGAFQAKERVDLQNILDVVGQIAIETKSQKRHVIQFEESLAKMNSFPYTVASAEEIKTFEMFMKICRGDPATPSKDQNLSPGPLTIACLKGWEAKQANLSHNWSKLITEKVPPGVLLLFLLVTLGGLYRYNLRLAGFHSTRADLIEYTQLQEITDPEAIGSLANTFAADKVEFGKSPSVPVEQAISVAKVLKTP